MLNDVLAVGVAGTVFVVIATILGTVELLRKAVAACRSLKLPTGLAATEDEVPHDNAPRRAEGSTYTLRAATHGRGMWIWCWKLRRQV